MTIKISVITVCKNAVESIETTIKSVLSQTYSIVEYIIIDGGSNDGTLDILSKYSNQIICHSEPDNGIYQAMNKGISLATGDYINFLNADDYFYDHKVVEDIVCLIKDLPYDVIYGNTHLRDNQFTFNKSSLSIPAEPTDLYTALITLQNFFFQGAIFFKADIFDKIGTFSEQYKIASDYEFFLRLLKDSSLQITYFPRTIFSYYQGGISSNVIKTLGEVFEIQNNIVVDQAISNRNFHVLKNYVNLLQESILRYQELSEKRKLLIEQQENLIKELQLLPSRYKTTYGKPGESLATP